MSSTCCVRVGELWTQGAIILVRCCRRRMSRRHHLVCERNPGFQKAAAAVGKTALQQQRSPLALSCNYVQPSVFLDDVWR